MKDNQGYKAEILLVGLAAVGMGLILTRVEIHLVLLNILKGWLNNSHATVDQAMQSIDGFITSSSLYDLIGYFLVSIGLIFLIYRLRRRYLNSLRWQGDICPRCQGAIQRIHRTPLDRFWGNILFRPLRRYKCTRPECGWSGLRYGKPHMHPDEMKRARPAEAAPK